jgi:hypothetical protein
LTQPWQQSKGREEQTTSVSTTVPNAKMRPREREREREKGDAHWLLVERIVDVGETHRYVPDIFFKKI